MGTEQPGYRSYLLRLWQVSPNDAASWRASLEDVRTHQRLTFASLEQLFACLLDQTVGMPDRDDTTPDTAV
jgi:hypothetical protein